MATTGVTMQPEVYAVGGGVADYYSLAGGETVARGDLIRITSAGTVKLAEASTSGAGALHGIVLEAATTSSTEVKIFKFATDTLIKIQCVDTVAPEDLAKGKAYTIEDGTNVWGITDTDTNGVLTVVDTAANRQPWTIARGGFDQTASTDNNAVIARVSQSILDGNAS